MWGNHVEQKGVIRSCAMVLFRGTADSNSDLEYQKSSKEYYQGISRGRPGVLA